MQAKTPEEQAVHVKEADIVIWACLGAILGFVIPVVACLIYVLYIKITEGKDADTTVAAAFSFFPIITIPLGIALGVLVGIIGVFPIFRG